MPLFHLSPSQIIRKVYDSIKTAIRVTITNGINDVDIIQTNGYYGLATVIPAKISTDNSTSETLLADDFFLGEWEGIENFGSITVTMKASHASAENGFLIEFSSDGVNIDSDDQYSIAAGAGKLFNFPAPTMYYRIKYTNGGDDQTYFRLQTKLSQTYVKPSSHRLSDSVVGDDDSELVKSIISGESVLSALFENITTYRGALNVNSAWVHRKIVNETFHEHDTATTTPNGSVSAGATSILVDSAVDFSVGDVVKISEGPLQEIGLLTITIIATNTITFDRPIGNDYTTLATIERVVANMAVNGSLASPVIFEVDPPTGTVWQITRLLISMVHATAADDGKFGGIPALTNGVSLRATTSAGRTVVFGNWKTNGDMALDMYDVVYSDKAPAGANGTRGRWTFTKSEVVAEIDGDADPVQKLDILIQDDLRGLIDFQIKAQGRVFSP